jgi:hypothetical protein
LKGETREPRKASRSRTGRLRGIARLDPRPGVAQVCRLLREVLQHPSTSVKFGDNQLGLGWFISSPGINPSGSIWKHSDLTGFNSYIAFLPSPGTPGVDPSQAGVFALVSADGITGDQQNGGIEVPMALANDILLIMQGSRRRPTSRFIPESRRQTARR